MTKRWNRGCGHCVRAIKRHRVPLAIALTLCSGAAWAQSTTGSIFGSVGGDYAKDVVVVQGSNGINRKLPIGRDGRYNFSSLPLGTYTVTLMRDDTVLGQHAQVMLRVNAGIQVDFADVEASDLAAVKVVASVPSIDVSTVDSRSVFSAEQLAIMPLQRSAEAIALLAPGTVTGSQAFGNGNLVSFGGSSVSENAYYINGFNTSDPLKNLGGISLPYGSIAQQEVLTGGYSAMYGRSDGGVISQVGKRGTDEWHYGAQVEWTPGELAAEASDTYYADGQYQGQLYKQGHINHSWTTNYSAYVGGPLIKDTLYLFLAGEIERRSGTSVGTSADSPAYNTHYQYRLPKYYAKIDWNINDSNTLELTGISSKEKYAGQLYGYDYDSLSEGDYAAAATAHKTGGNIYIAKYTGYLTDNLTLSALYGQSHLRDLYYTPGYDSSDASVNNAQYQDPSITGGSPIYSSQTTGTITDPSQGNRTQNLRIDLEYRLGRHQIRFGIDNQTAYAINRGSITSGPGYSWNYGWIDPSEEINSTLGVGAPGGDGYYVQKVVYSSSESVKSVQHAQYVEDNWQVTDNLLLSLGLRNDSFKNYNSDNVIYVEQDHQFAPRLGFSWDVHGDASLKVFGNAGRYYLSMPNYVALAAASSTTSTQQYYTYTGIDANGAPTGLTAISGVVSVNGNYGSAPDPKTVAATNLSSEYQDEFMLGASQALDSGWVVGTKATYRALRNAIDDVCDYDAIYSKAASMGYDMSVAVRNSGCYLFNPGKTNTFLIGTTTGAYYAVPMSNSDFGFTSGTKRSYYALELFAEYPMTGEHRWGGKLDYIWSRSYGNTEGQVRSDRSQSSVSTTADWDYASLMSYANGVLSNDRTHQFKVNGTYRITPQWTASAIVSIASGAPKSCLGLYGADQTDPSGYGAVYHWCNGESSAPGDAGRLPWTHKLDLSVEYRPAFAKRQLAFNLSVFNVFNEQNPVLLEYARNSSRSLIYYLYNTTLYREAPRSMRFGIRYDY